MEKTLITSKRCNTKIILFGFLVVVLIAYIALVYYGEGGVRSIAHNLVAIHQQNYGNEDGYRYIDAIKSVINTKLHFRYLTIITAPIVFFLLPMSIIGIVAYLSISKTEITVTDKRVYGRARFGKRVDLPLDKISAVAQSWPKGIAVATSSGRISFCAIKNRDNIYECINVLLIERQDKTRTLENNQIINQASDADELKKYKDLLDAGVITQDEFDVKKKQLLGL